MHSTTKTNAIRNALMNGDRLTHMKALAYGTHRLAAVVFRLKKQGMDIRVTTKRDSNGMPFAEYYVPRVSEAGLNVAA